MSFRAKDFYDANKTKLLMYPQMLSLDDDIPATVTITVATGGATLSATSIPVTATTRKLYKDTDLRFGAVTATLTADAPVGATALTVKPLSGAIAAAATAVTRGLAPFVSFNSANTGIEDDTVSSRNMGSGAWGSSRKNRLGANIPVSGFAIKSDPLYEFIHTAAFSLERVYFELIDPDASVESGVALVRDWEKTREEGNNVEISFRLEVDGELVRTPAA